MAGAVTQLNCKSKVHQAHQYTSLLPYYYGIRTVEGLGTVTGKKQNKM